MTLPDDLTGWAAAAPGADEAAIAEAERRLGDSLPDELRGVYADANGITAGADTLLWPLDKLVSENLEFRDNEDFAELYMPFEGLLFFGDVGNGDLYFVSQRGINEVYRWDHELDERRWAASGIVDFLNRWYSGTLPSDD